MRCAWLLSALLFLSPSAPAGWGEGAKAHKAAALVLSAQTGDTTFLKVGEELEYNVSYSFFNIGTVYFKILGSEIRNGRSVFKAKVVIESNPSLRWLTEVHIRFYGEMDDSVFSWYWMSEDSSKSGIDFHSLTFLYDDSLMVYRKGKTTVSGVQSFDEVDTVRIQGRNQDGLSLFYFARKNARQKREAVVPTVIDNKEEKTYIDFQNKLEDVEIDAVDYPIETVFFDGKADFVGVVGLTGRFRGWFSNDDARIPIVARLSVWLGSIKVELKRWNRPGWIPPRYIEQR
jgi:hypothetical protein